MTININFWSFSCIITVDVFSIHDDDDNDYHYDYHHDNDYHHDQLK